MFRYILIVAITKVRLSDGEATNLVGHGMRNVSGVTVGDVPVSMYPWLGILYYTNPTTQGGDSPAVITVALIHKHFTIAPASDIGPMQKDDFKKSRVLLGESWGGGGLRVRGCLVHPEYAATRSTVALVQLRDTVNKNVKPVSLPIAALLRNPKYYVLKFHEDYDNLQKQMIPVTHTPEKVCKDFYSSKRHAKRTQPRSVVCATTDDQKTCMWYAGAALVSKDVTGKWQLLGLGVRGPGCGAPARFSRMINYLSWVRHGLDMFKNKTKELYRDRLLRGEYDETTTTEATTIADVSFEDDATCPALLLSTADIDVIDIYPTLNFEPRWAKKKTIWNKGFEERYEKMRRIPNRPTLKVFVVPHSHNDPGWTSTFETYFTTKTKNIITNMVQKLRQYPNMTFIWSEISFLDAWWKSAPASSKKVLKKLITRGRLEITTGGWVMADEACTHLYGLLDQLVEGHDWIRRNLGESPRTGWSVDPFGHGPTVPHLLEKSGLEAAVIQRIHFAWKHWFATKQIQEFEWIPGWYTDRPSIIMHNQPFDLYSTKYSCGPHTSVCLNYDFRLIEGEITEYSKKHEDITEENVHVKAKTLIEEYRRVGSLTEHNVVLVPLGDDFRYEHEAEFDAQYINYVKLFNYINGHKDQFNAEIQFGTPLDYFNAMKEHVSFIPTLRGDFFVYSDIFSDGVPSYWSGFYSSRPYFKICTRQLEHHLRTSEILFTLVLNYIKQNFDPKLGKIKKKLEQSYALLITARQNHGLFQHHDAITGTSKAHVMRDYASKLFTSLNDCLRLQELALTIIMIPDKTLHSQRILKSDIEWETFDKLPKKVYVSSYGKRKVVVFNPLSERRTEVITVRSNTTSIRVFDNRQRKHVQYQITPIIDVGPNGRRVISDSSFELMFVANLPPLTAVSFNLEEYSDIARHCEVFCNRCNEPQKPNSKKLFKTKKMIQGDIQLENSYLTLMINRTTGFLKRMFINEEEKPTTAELRFGSYQSTRRRSGPYLFKPDYESHEDNILDHYTNNIDDKMVIISGPVSTEIQTTYWPFLIHTLRIYHVEDIYLAKGVLMENYVDFENPPKNMDTELFMRLQTDIQNGAIPEYYTDQNGFHYQKRVKVDKLGIEGNYYPITTMAWLQDDSMRLTLITNHAQGSSSYEQGRLEVMLDRRMLYDDNRGIGEGVVDNKPTVYRSWLLLEATYRESRRRRGGAAFRHVKQRHFGPEEREANFELPSQTADFLSRALNYPVHTYLIDSTEAGEVAVKPKQNFVGGFPAGVHLVTLRTITDDVLEQFPSGASYMVLQRPGHSCTVGRRTPKPAQFTAQSRFDGLAVSNLTAVSLTGLRSLRALRGLQDITLQPMDLNTYRISF